MLNEQYVKQFFTDPANHSGIWYGHFKNYISIPNRIADAQTFRNLDVWYHGLDVSKGYLTQPELVQIMKWKLTRGKMRPLLKKIEALSDVDVRNVTCNAFSIIRHHVENSIKNRPINIVDILTYSLDEKTVRLLIETVSKPWKV